MKRMNCLVVAMLVALSGNVFATTGEGLKVLTDSEMSAETGQALFNLSYIALSGTNPTAGVGFYKLGMVA